ncbi:MAG TPA: hypothetical protein VMJ35_01675 [Dongiaceae bacterium]|nr:hypothetical protein [Dongiaceae bacterium]
MNLSRLASLGQSGPPRAGWVIRMHLLFMVVFVCSNARISAQEGPDKVLVDKQTLQTLLQRVDELEARVKSLEAGSPQALNHGVTREPGSAPASAIPLSATAMRTPNSTLSAAAPQLNTMSVPAGHPASNTTMPAAGSTATMPPQEQEPSQSENMMAERMDLSKTLLRIRGFGDVNFGGNTMHGSTTSFSLGQLDLFTTSDISEKFKFLSEIVFEGGTSNIYGQPKPGENALDVDLERYVLQYSYNDYFNISAGRVHTAIGYYNTAYHHSTWLQTTTGRPFLFRFEDEGGILPIHTVGVSASGIIPSGALGLHYVAEVGNGRESRTPQVSEPVQNIVDENNHKAFNLALFARPEAIRGLQAGFSVYRDVLEPLNSPRVGQTIFAAHAVLVRSNYEWLNEAMLIRESLFGENKVYNTPGFYTQVSKQFGAWRPYLRYQYVNTAKTNPIFPDVGLQHGPSVGIRYDASEFVALKFQYDYTYQRQPQPAINALTMQVGFTF